MHLHVRTCTPFFHISQRLLGLRYNLVCCLVPTRSYSGLTQDGGGVHLHVRTCTPLGGTERRLIELSATRTTNLRSAALPQKRCLVHNRRLVEHERPHEQPTFGPQRYPKSAASQVTEGWLNMRQQLFVRIVVFSMRNQPERSRRGGFSKVAADFCSLLRS